jgi:hypothetical protein
MFTLCGEYAVIRNDECIGTVVATPARALGVALDEYGTGIMVRHIASMPEQDKVAYGVPS